MSNSLELAKVRLISQHLTVNKFTKVKELVAYFGAMQAQDYLMSKWAVGVRIPGSNIQLIDDALDKGEILRTHVLRPTWHLVSSEDIRWLIELSSSRIRAAMKSRNNELRLTDQIFKKCNSIIRSSLSDENHLTREEMVTILKKSGIATDENRASHIFFHAELEGLICSGRIKNNKPTYALLDERVPDAASLSREESLKKLALKYFSSHGPATHKDFTWWSGLTAKQASIAIEMAGSFFIKEQTERGTYIFPDNLNDSADKENVLLLPAYDEFLISYSDRTASTLPIHHKGIISNNGIFKPVIVVNGQVAGIWKRTIIKEKVFIETFLFNPLTSRLKKTIEKKAGEYGKFLDKEVTVNHTENAAK